MRQTLEDKQRIVSDLNKVAANAHSAIAADYRGLTVAEMTQLRSRAREQNVYLRVFKNTLARRGLDGTSYQCMSEGLIGPLVLAFSQEDPSVLARLFKDFIKENEKVEIKMIAMEGALMDLSTVDRLAALPTRDEAIAMLMGVMKQPIAQFARTLSVVPAKLVRIFAAIKEQKEQVSSSS